MGIIRKILEWTLLALCMSAAFIMALALLLVEIIVGKGGA